MRLSALRLKSSNTSPRDVGPQHRISATGIFIPISPAVCPEIPNWCREGAAHPLRSPTYRAKNDQADRTLTRFKSAVSAFSAIPFSAAFKATDFPAGSPPISLLQGPREVRERRSAGN